MAKFRKRSAIVEAMQWDGSAETERRIFDWIPLGGIRNHGGILVLGTIEVHVGDWIVQQAKYEFYICKPDVFEATYEPVSDEQKERWALRFP